jgi:hypothetical protein
MNNINTIDLIKQYSVALDSVNVINTLVNSDTAILIDGTSYISQQDINDTISRNVKFLNSSINRTFWTTQDLSPLSAAIISGNSYIINTTAVSGN